jgi:hypothetical protein
MSKVYVCFKAFEQLINNFDNRVIYGTNIISESKGVSYDEFHKHLLKMLKINEAIFKWDFHKKMKKKVIKFAEECPDIMSYQGKTEATSKINKKIFDEVVHHRGGSNKYLMDTKMVFFVCYSRCGFSGCRKDKVYLDWLFNLKNMLKRDIKKLLIQEGIKFYPTYKKCRLIGSLLRQRPYNYNWNNYDGGVEVLQYEHL